MAKPKHPSRRYRIRTGHSLYQVGTEGLGDDARAIVKRVEVLGPNADQRVEDGFVVAASVKDLEGMLAPIDWLRYYVFFSRGRAKTFARQLQLAINAHYHKAGAL